MAGTNPFTVDGEGGNGHRSSPSDLGPDAPLTGAQSPFNGGLEAFHDEPERPPRMAQARQVEINGDFLEPAATGPGTSNGRRVVSSADKGPTTRVRTVRVAEANRTRTRPDDQGLYNLTLEDSTRTDVFGDQNEIDDDAEEYAPGEDDDGLHDASDIHRKHTRVKRHRWGTQRNPQGRPPRRQRSNALGRQLSTLVHGGMNLGHSVGNAMHPHHNNDSRQSTPEPEGPGGSEARSPRQIYFGQALPTDHLDPNGLPLEQFARNKIRTTKYTPLSFVPKNLLLQFKNVANIYFLFIVILGAFPIFGVQNPGLSAVPIVVIVVITAIKDAVEDYRRTLMDLEVNNGYTEILKGYRNPNVVEENVSLWRRFKKANTRLVMKLARWIDSKKADHIQKKTGVRPKTKSAFNQELSDMASVYSRESFEISDLRSGGDPESIVNANISPNPDAKFKGDYWKNVKVGDFVRVRSDQEIPADLVILATSEDDGACYVETKNLDGETNLKIRQALRCGQGIRRPIDCTRAEFEIDSEAPMPNLYAYSGAIRWPDSEVGGGTRSEPITINNLLLRGCTLRNTGWVIGAVLFTGMDTKIMLNAGVTPTKRSFLSKSLNLLVIYNFILLFIMCLASGIVNGVKRRNKRSTFNYFEWGSPAGSAAANGVVTFWAVLILYQSLVPISLYISIEIIKTVQAFFIYSDCYMYYEPVDYPCTPKSWNISDDLGQIEYVFSDKTGTLTQNVMEFKKCSVNGVAYGKAYTEALAGLRKREGIDTDVEGAQMTEEIARDRVKMLKELRSIDDNRQMVEEEVTFVSSDFVSDMQGQHGKEQAEANKYFMLCLALCNSVITEPSKKHKGRNDFKAQSPDEAALVATARDLGFTLVARTRRGLVINVQGHESEYQVLNTLEFNSTRKRMSAIVRIDNRIMLICKGADSVIYKRLSTDASPEQQRLRNVTAVQLEEFANEGLRTLCIAHREISPADYAAWNHKYEDASTQIQDREAALDEVAEIIERDLLLLGGTAIEDRLQEGVPRTISLLGDGGVKLWVLTGDKVETAINIGFSCNLLDNSMELLVIKVENGDRGSVPAQIDEYLHKNFGLDGLWDELERAKNDHSPPNSRFAVVIDGDALKLALNPAISHKFLLLCKQCKSVLCCRVSPAQKAAVVRLVREKLDVITLAIGDGANDVAMIQEANVGVGIAGEEGRQAVMSSDYAFGQFRFLARLMLVHGRYSYRRLAEMVPNFFYKNVLFTVTLFWYGIACDFDATYLFEYTFVMFFNLAFTSLPVIFMGILDQDVPDRISLAVPQLYRRGILRLDFTQWKFWLYMIEGIYQSFVCYFFPYWTYSPGRFESMNGLPVHQRYWMGLAVCTLAVMSANLYVVTNQYRWDWVSLLVNVVSTVLVWFWAGVYSPFEYIGELYNVASEEYGLLNFWAVILLGTITCMLIHFTNMTMRAFFMPQDVDIIREQWRLGEFDAVMATPLSADDPDAAKYENPYRTDTHKPMTPLNKHAPYELSPDSHAGITKSPDFVRLGNDAVAAEEFVWDRPQTPVSPTAHDYNRKRESRDPELRRSLDEARRHSRWEQPPVDSGVENVGLSRDLDTEMTTAEGLIREHRRSASQPRRQDSAASRRSSRRESQDPSFGRMIDDVFN